MSLSFKCIVVATGLLIPGLASAQSYTTGGGTWTSSYGFPSPTERAVRLQYMDTQRRLEAGFYDPSNYTTNYHIYNDHSVGDTTISAAEGAHVMIENRTGANSGTNTYAVGSVTTSTSTIVIDGDGNIIDIAASSSSTGCQDGSISMTMNQIFDTIDISSGASGSFSSSTSRTTGGCND